MKRVISLMFVAGMMLALATGAQAASLDIVGGTAGFIPATTGQNEFVGLPAPRVFSGQTTVAGFFGSQINFTVAGAGTITFTYFGGEAGFTDTFQYTLGTTLFTHNTGDPVATAIGSPISTVGPLALSGPAGTLLPFRFTTNSGGGPVNGPTNGTNSNSGVPSFFASCGAPSAANGVTSCGTAATPLWLWLDDNGGLKPSGANDDDDFDDMLIRVVVTDGPPTVPEPTSFALLGSGLLGLGLAARKLRK